MATPSFTSVDTSLLWTLFVRPLGVHITEVLLYLTIKYHLPNRVIKIWFLGGLPTDYKAGYTIKSAKAVDYKSIASIKPKEGLTANPPFGLTTKIFKDMFLQHTSHLSLVMCFSNVMWCATVTQLPNVIVVFLKLTEYYSVLVYCHSHSFHTLD